MKIKKHISVMLASALAASSFSAVSASAESYGDNVDIMVLGDSIASGYGLTENQYNYGQLIADYLGGNVYNYAVSGYDSTEALALLRGFSAEQKSQLAESDVVIISIGGNDMIGYAASSLIEFAAANNLLAEGKTIDDLPENKNFDTLSEFVDIDALKAFAGNFVNSLVLNNELSSIYQNITYTDENNNGSAYVQVIAKTVIPNIKAMRDEIKAANPQARVIVQTVYNPLQFSSEYEANLKESVSATYFTAYSTFKTYFSNITRRFSEQLKEVDGIEIADVLTDISSTDSNKQSYGWYFTKAQGGKNLDIHPTQAGHTAIAVNILNVLGEKREDGGLLKMTFDSLKNYPAYALEQYKKVAGSYCLGDITEDGLIDSSDASIILQQYALVSTGKDISVSAAQFEAAKLTDDDVVDASDASVALAYYAYISTGGKGSFKYFVANK
ncbi:MAG: hypothetical protein IKK66_05725 [Ruminococcus sp.]|nr:hypothetical protein [Ruminococcus sp.]